MEQTSKINEDRSLDDIARLYHRDGFFCPMPALSEVETLALREDYEAAEYDLRNDQKQLSLF